MTIGSMCQAPRSTQSSSAGSFVPSTRNAWWPMLYIPASMAGTMAYTTMIMSRLRSMGSRTCAPCDVRSPGVSRKDSANSNRGHAHASLPSPWNCGR